jgi:hypothetical protein
MLASTGLQKSELCPVVPRPIIVVATVDIGGYRRGASADRRALRWLPDDRDRRAGGIRGEDRGAAGIDKQCQMAPPQAAILEGCARVGAGR